MLKRIFTLLLIGTLPMLACGPTITEKEISYLVVFFIILPLISLLFGLLKNKSDDIRKELNEE